MANSPNVSIRSNSVPPGGTTTLTPSPPTQTSPELAALIDELTPTITKFRQNSSPQNVNLDDTVLGIGAEQSIRIASVGLGVFCVSHHSLSITLDNTSTSSQSVSLSPHFPYNNLANTSIAINVGSKTYSASGAAGLFAAARTRRTALKNVSNGLDAALVNVTFGSNLTPTGASSMTLSGYSSVSVAASSSGTITADFVTLEKLAYSLDTLIGALPLQNNSVFATLTRRSASSILGTDVSTPLYVSGGVPSTLSATATMTTKTEYDYWSVTSDPTLYAPMVTNSYQLLEQEGLSTQSTGNHAIAFPIPQNELLIAIHMIAKNGTAGAQSYLPKSAVNELSISYNGGKITPVTEYQVRQRAKQFLVYGYDVQDLPGYRMWDGDDTSDSINNTDSAGWIDAYTAASPYFYGDVVSGTSLPINYSITRESIGQGQVQVL